MAFTDNQWELLAAYSGILFISSYTNRMAESSISSLIPQRSRVLFTFFVDRNRNKFS